MLDDGNPMYYTRPSMPPGAEALRYVAGHALGMVTGDRMYPYVGPNQSTFGAMYASGVINPLYNATLQRAYGQMGYQIGNTAGGVPLLQRALGAAGYSEAEVRKAMADGGRAIGTGPLGQFIMPGMDAALSWSGLSGGSIIGTTEAVLGGRIALAPTGMPIDPLDAGYQHRTMGAASAMATMLNGIMSRTDDAGRLTALPNLAVTHGFDRQRVAKLVMQAAAYGMFNSTTSGGIRGMSTVDEGGFADQLVAAMGTNPLDDMDAGFDMGQLDFTRGDFTRGVKGRGGRQLPTQLHEFGRKLAERVKGLTAAMGALRDMTHEVDGLEEALTDLTNGGWMRGGTSAHETHDAIRALHAVSMMYNLDPKATVQRLVTNRTVLQDAMWGGAEQGAAMRGLGFTGGGLFGLAAQTELMASTEDLIRTRRISDPILAERLRQQRLQNGAQGINSVAGRGAALLAYARQHGIVTEEDADRLNDQLTSGSRSLMGASLDQLLTLMYGSVSAGRRHLNDQMHMSAIRESLTDESGAYAMRMLVKGSDREFAEQERITVATQRLAQSQDALAAAGLNTWQDDAGARRVAASIAQGIRASYRDANGRYAQEGIQLGNAFQQQVNDLIASGYDARTALNSVADSFKRNPATAKLGDIIDLSAKNAATANNISTLRRLGRTSWQATAMATALARTPHLDGARAAEIFELVRSGRGDDALSDVEGVVSKLSPDQQAFYERIRSDASDKYNAAMALAEDNLEVARLVEDAGKSGYGGNDVADAYTNALDAARQYLRGQDTDGAYRAFMERFSKSGFSKIWGPEATDEFLDEVAKGDFNSAYFTRMGRQAALVRQAAVANLGEHGYGIGQLGAFGGGLYSGNSLERQRLRDQMIENTGVQLTKNSENMADLRGTITQDAFDLLTGTKDLRAALKQYDPSGEFTDQLTGYIAAHESYVKAEAKYSGSLSEYMDVVSKLSHAGKRDEARWLQDALDKGWYDNDSRKAIRGRVMRWVGLLDDEDMERVLNTLEAHGAMSKTLTTMGDELRAVKDQDGFTSAQLGPSARYVYQQRKNAAIAHGPAAQYMEDLALGVAKQNPWTGRALEAVYKAVTDEEVAQAAGVPVHKDIRRDKAFLGSTFSVLRDKAKYSVAASEAMEQVHKAALAGSTRVYGELTIRNGKERVTASLNAQAAGRLDQ